mgnify:FL=1
MNRLTFYFTLIRQGAQGQAYETSKPCQRRSEHYVGPTWDVDLTCRSIFAPFSPVALKFPHISASTHGGVPLTLTLEPVGLHMA